MFSAVSEEKFAPTENGEYSAWEHPIWGSWVICVLESIYFEHGTFSLIDVARPPA
jgi:hypothetical protein